MGAAVGPVGAAAGSGRVGGGLPEGGGEERRDHRNAAAPSSAIDPYGRVCVNTSAVVDAHIMEMKEGEGTVKWHYVGLADDGENAAVFDAVFTKNRDDNATAAPTPTPGSDGAAGRSAGLLVALAAAAAAL